MNIYDNLSWFVMVCLNFLIENPNWSLINSWLIVDMYNLKHYGVILMFLSRIYYAIAYLVVLILEIIKSTIDMCLRIFKSKGFEPIVIDIDTELKRPISQTILANSITLTPGTLSVDLDSENQVIKVAVIAPRDVKDIIPFEPYIKGMLE